MKFTSIVQLPPECMVVWVCLHVGVLQEQGRPGHWGQGNHREAKAGFQHRSSLPTQLLNVFIEPL
jgi:hypothetical protein